MTFTFLQDSAMITDAEEQPRLWNQNSTLILVSLVQHLVMLLSNHPLKLLLDRFDAFD